MGQVYLSLQDQAYLKLQEMIMKDELHPDIVYSETKMAKEMNISRTPFRAALVRLSQDKYIDIIPSKGFKVHVPDDRDIETTFQIRTAVESYCAVLLNEQKDQEDARATIEKMQCSQDEMQCIAEKDDNKRFQELDRIFHSELILYAHNEEFTKLYDFSIYHQIVSLSKKSSFTTDEKIITCREHDAILKAIKNGPVGECYFAVSAHMKTNKENSIANMKK